MLDRIRRTLEDLVNGSLPPEQRRAAAARMKETLVMARLGLDDVRRAVAETQARLSRERTELETARRRGGLAAGIGDTETVAIAERFARQHEERVSVLERKLDAQQAELAAAERDVEEMTRELRGVINGTGSAAPSATATPREPVAAAGAATGDDDATGGRDDAGAAAAATVDVPDAGMLRDELESIARARSRAARDAAAEEQLAALKRRMGK